MTTPKIETVAKWSSRFYVHPDTKEQVPGVTSVIGMAPKDFLRYWAAKMTAETAYDEFGTLASFVASQKRDSAVDWLKGASNRYTKTAADRGTTVHDLVERIALGDRVPPQHPDIQGYLDNFNEFLDVWQPEYHSTEQTVWSSTHGYAGSYDAIVTIDGTQLILDVKTGKAVYPDVALQMTAYARGDFILGSDGSETPIPAIDHGVVLHLHNDKWELVPVAISDGIFETFLALRKVFDWQKDLSRGVIGKPLRKGEES